MDGYPSAAAGRGNHRGRWRDGVLLLLFVLAFVPLAVVGHRALAATARLRAVQEESARLREQLPVLQRAATRAAAIKGLTLELTAVRCERPSLTAVLLELTRRIGRETWMDAFTWMDGNVEIQLRTDREVADLRENLEESPVLGDVAFIAKTVTGGTTALKLQLRARFDTEDELQQAHSSAGAKAPVGPPPLPAAGPSAAGTGSAVAPPPPPPPPALGTAAAPAVPVKEKAAAVAPPTTTPTPAAETAPATGPAAKEKRP